MINQAPALPRSPGAWVATLAVFGLSALAACAPVQKETAPADRPLELVRAGFADLPGWADDNHADALDGFRRSCRRVVEGTALRATIGGVDVDRAAWKKTCDASFRVRPGDNALSRKFFERHFTPFVASAGGQADGLFTGYYEASLKGSMDETEAYAVPLYEPPENTVTIDLAAFDPALGARKLTGQVVANRVLPLPDRAAIDAGALDGKGLELLWVSSAADAFFLHVQGSGRVEMEDGTARRVGFAGRNGHAYTAIGRVLIDRGEIAAKDMSMQAIRDWIAANPDEAGALMAENKSYIFFRFLDGDGPVGASGVTLTPGRSLAIDPKHMAYGLPVWLETVDPLDTDKPLARLLIAQDTGAAIRGAVRGDVFWGAGDEAARRAGRMKGRGRAHVLLPVK